MKPLAHFKIYGNPIPQGRPRVIKKGAHYSVKDPDKSRIYKDGLHLLGQKHRIEPLPTGPLGLRLTFEMLKPKTVRKRERWRAKKPDMDNLVKAVLDAMNGILYRDDAQIVYLVALKPYSDSPGVTIELWAQE